MTPRKTAADYAAIAVAPVLIFLMISSLANFLILMFYRGGFQSRLSWTVLCFTMGIVAVARIAIERDRSYSYGYAAALGLATLLVMTRLVDSLVFSVFILVVVGYLADVIVRDCTLIDEDVDASGEGLVDSGHLFLRKQVQSPADEENEPEAGAARSKRKTSQPGRTVMYLALGALPLFGLGQFFLRNDAASWTQAKYLLAFYLFASLSLLVTTSFVGLRRYLRQRKVEMPREVAIAWFSAGLALIAAVLCVAYFSPMPGRVLASFELPVTFDSPGNTFASRFGWGDEGADQSNPDASGTTNDPNADGKEIQGSVDKKGGKPGGSGEGDRKDGPAGRKQGGKKSGGSQQSDSSGQGGKKSEQQSKTGSEQGQATKTQNQSKGQQSPEDVGRDQSSGRQAESQSQQPDSGDSDSGDSDSGDSDSGDSDSGDSDSGDSGQPDSGEGESSAAESSDSQESDDSDSQSPDSQASQTSQSQSGSGQSQDSSSGAQSRVGETISSAVSMLGSVLKFLIFAVLVAIVGVFLWRNWELIRQWFLNFLGTRESDDVVQHATAMTPSIDAPPRPFSSFRNPIGRETDLRRVMIVTFQAFEAWSWEFGVMRRKEETPAEFTRRVARTLPNDSFSQLPAHASQVVEAYNRIVYGRGNATQRDVAAAEQVWNVMRSQRMR